jgi:anti-sigma regulatory factor (Ser/Thr protein kinase)
VSPPHIADVARAVGVAAGLMAVGAAAGVVAERAVVAKAGRADREGDEPFGHLRGQPLTVESDGTMLHVEVEPCTRANPEGITVVFCHGYALNQDCWHYQRRDLRALGDLVFWDQRSHGRSGRSVAETNTIDQLGRDLKVVLDELIANTFMHGCGEQQDGWLKVSLERRDNCLSLIFEDNGEPFDPLQQESEEITGSLADRPIGGLGLLLVKSLTDVQQYHRAEDRNILVLCKNLN